MFNKMAGKSSLVFLFRLLAVAFCGFLWAFQQDADYQLTRLWGALVESRLFQHESFEPFLATASFLFFIGLWGFLDFCVPWAAKCRTFPSDDVSAWFGGTRLRDQALWYIAPLVTLDIMFPRRHLPASAPSLARLVLDVVGAIAVYDVAFFGWHVAVHSNPHVYRRVHARHHQCYVQRAPEAVRHTFIDGTMDVVCSVFAINLLRLHPLSRAVYNVVIIGLITELHAGYDLPWQLHNVVPFGLLGGPPRHEIHHREGKVYMQKFGTYLDELFGFVPRDAGRSSSSKQTPTPLHRSASDDVAAPCTLGRGKVETRQLYGETDAARDDQEDRSPACS
eukprot:g6402.t1